MTPQDLERERAKSASALDRVVENTRTPEVARTSEAVLAPPTDLKAPVADEEARGSELPPWNPPVPPDLRPVNKSFRTGTERPSALSSFLEGRGKAHEAQEHFNADQVRLDNALVAWTADHFAATHKHYDAVISQMQKRMDEIDARHRELEKELVRHVHEMARRIDVVLGEGEKGRVSHEGALRSVRERLRALEEKLG